MKVAPFPSLAAIAAGGKRAVAAALALIETARGTPELAALLDAAVVASKGHVTGLTGPPGVGKSTLASALLKGWRQAGENVAIACSGAGNRDYQTAGRRCWQMFVQPRLAM